MRSKNFGLLVPSLVLLALACNDHGIGDPAPVAEVRVTPSSRSIPVGGTLQLNAFVLDAQGGTLTGRSVIWSSSAPTIATVDATGLVTGVSGGGPVTITASSEGRPGTAQVTVTGPALIAVVSVTPGASSILVGTAVQLVATAKDAQGNTQYNRAVTWSSSAEAVATVDATGIVTGVSAGGPVTITATSEGKAGTAQVTVTAPVPPPAPGYTLSLSASTLSIVQGAATSTTVDLARTNFTGSVTLRVENLPAGVSAYFQPYPNPPAMWLFVAGNALPGTYPDLLVRGVAFGLSDRTAPFTLTITGAPFILTLSSSTLSIVQGAATSTTVNVVRTNYAGPVTLFAYGDPEDDGAFPPGVTVAFSTNPVTGDSSVLTVSVGAATVPGVYLLWVSGWVSGEASTERFVEIITLTVTARSP